MRFEECFESSALQLFESQNSSSGLSRRGSEAFFTENASVQSDQTNDSINQASFENFKAKWMAERRTDRTR